MTVNVITAPSTYLVTRAEVKAHLRIDTSDHDDMIDRLILVVSGFMDGPRGDVGRAIKPQTLELVLDEFPAGPIRIPYPPLQSVDSIKYISSSTGLETTLSGLYYQVDAPTHDFGWVLLSDGYVWPEVMEVINAVRIRYTAGYVESPPEVPEQLRHAALFMIGDLFQHPESVVVGTSASEIPMSTTVSTLIDRYRVRNFV